MRRRIVMKIVSLPEGIPPKPRLWKREDVVDFLKWCEKEFDLPPFDMDLFQMNGKALCLLTKTDLGERSPGAGDVLHNVLQMLVRDDARFGRCFPSSDTPIAKTTPYLPSNRAHPPKISLSVDEFRHVHNAATDVQTKSVTLSSETSIDDSDSKKKAETINFASVYIPPAPISIQTSSGTNQSDSDEDIPLSSALQSPKKTILSNHSDEDTSLLAAIQSPKKTILSNQSQINSEAEHEQYHTHLRELLPNETPISNTNRRLLCDFLQHLLNDPTRYANYITWKRRESSVFKIVDPNGLAKLWGIQKNHLSMNYDKMSRALRYYYRINVMRKVRGEQHCYQFLKKPTPTTKKRVKRIAKKIIKKDRHKEEYVEDVPTETCVAIQQVVKTEINEDHGEDDYTEQDMQTDKHKEMQQVFKTEIKDDPCKEECPRDMPHEIHVSTQVVKIEIKEEIFDDNHEEEDMPMETHLSTEHVLKTEIKEDYCEVEDITYIKGT